MKTLTSAPKLLAGLSLAGSIFLTHEVNAQMLPTAARQARRYVAVSVHLNAMNYFGDLAPKPAFTSFRFGATRPNLGVSITKRISPRISGRAALSYGRITGDDSKSADKNDNEAIYRYNRNIKFRNDIVELSLVGTLDLFENRGSYLKRRDFAPYLFLGVAGFYHNPKGPDQNGNYVALQPLGTEGQKLPNPTKDVYNRLQVSIPFGIGVNYKLNRQLNLGYEIGWRKTFTDYLDDVSGVYINRNDPGIKDDKTRYFSDPSDQSLKDPNSPNFSQQFRGAYGVAGSKRGTDNEDDWYIVSGFHLSYILIPQTKSPKFR